MVKRLNRSHHSANLHSEDGNSYFFAKFPRLRRETLYEGRELNFASYCATCGSCLIIADDLDKVSKRPGIPTEQTVQDFFYDGAWPLSPSQIGFYAIFNICNKGSSLMAS